MADERRKDIGSKVMVSTISILLGIILHMSWTSAQNAVAMAITNKGDIRELKANALNVKEIVVEIKQDVKKILRTRKWASVGE